jgi:hypothetical protein
MLKCKQLMWMHIVMEEHHTVCRHSTPFVLNDHMHFFSVLQYTSDVTVVPCCMNSTIRTFFLSQKTVSISFLAGRRLFKLLGLFGECASIHCFDCSLVSTFTNETQVSSRYSYNVIEKFITIFVVSF